MDRILLEGKIHKVERIVNDYVHYWHLKVIPKKDAVFANRNCRQIAGTGMLIKCGCRSIVSSFQDYIETVDGVTCCKCNHRFIFACTMCNQSDLAFRWANDTLIIICNVCERKPTQIKAPVIKGSLQKCDRGITLDGIPCPDCGIVKYNTSHGIFLNKGTDNVLCCCGKKLSVPYEVANKIAKNGSIKSWIDCDLCNGTHPIKFFSSEQRSYLNSDYWEVYGFSCGNTFVEVEDIGIDEIFFWREMS